MQHLAQRAGTVQAQPPGAAREELLNLALQLAPQPAWRLARGGAEAQRLVHEEEETIEAALAPAQGGEGREKESER